MRDKLSRKEVAVVLRVYRFAERAHGKQMRSSGIPYISHPMAVANMVADMGLDARAISAALLHDVIEDTGVSQEDIKKDFGEEIAHLVEGLTKLRDIKKQPLRDRSMNPSQSANYQKLVLAMARDPRVILIKTLGSSAQPANHSFVVSGTAAPHCQGNDVGVCSVGRTPGDGETANGVGGPKFCRSLSDALQTSRRGSGKGASQKKE